MNIEKIEYGPKKEGYWADVAFALIVLLTLVAAAITGMIIWKVITSDPSDAATRPFVESVGKLLAYLLFILGAILYLYVKGLLQNEYVTTVE